MALLLDTRTVEPGDRADAVAAASRSARVPATLIHQVPDADVHARLELWDLGGGLSLMHRTSSGIRLVRSAKQVRGAAEDRVAVTALGPGTWSFSQLGDARTVRTRRWDTVLVDHAAPYEFVRSGDGSTYAFSIDHAALGLRGDVVRRAAPRLRDSPLHELVRRHVLELARTVDRIPAGPVLATLGSATVELVRAYLLSAAGVASTVESPTPDALLARTQLYVRTHALDPDLGPASIARAHAVSVRQLYAAWSRHEETLAGYVIGQRLQLARRALAEHPGRTVAAVAHACGFADASHFSRRFRLAYGMSPREWRRTLSTETGTQGPESGPRRL